MILKSLQNSEDQRLEYTGESKKISNRVNPPLPVASPFRKPLPHPLPIPDSTLFDISSIGPKRVSSSLENFLQTISQALDNYDGTVQSLGMSRLRISGIV
jgi:hypothetical protein